MLLMLLDIQTDANTFRATLFKKGKRKDNVYVKYYH